jgi:YVTN family beta-propeller protein
MGEYGLGSRLIPGAPGRLGRGSRIGKVTGSPISRRSLLLSSAAALGCGVRKSTPYHGYCFVANQGSRSVAAVDLETFRVRRQIPLDAAPSLVLSHPHGRPRVYVLAPNAGTVYEIDSGALAVGRRARAGNQAVAMQMAASGDSLWVLYRDPPALVELPLDSLRPRNRIALRSLPDSLALTGSGAEAPYAAIGSRQDNSITLASLRGGEPRRFAAGVEPSLVGFRKDGKQVLAGSRPGRNLSIFDAATGRTVVRLPLPLGPRYFQSNADGWLFITGDGIDAVVIVFPFSTEVWQTVLAGRRPGAMAVAGGSTEYLLVANPESDSITVLDLAIPKLVGVIGVGQSPGQILVIGGKRPDEQFVLVVNQKSGDMAVVRMLALSEPQLSSKPRLKSVSLLTMIPVGEGPVSADVVAL